MKAQRAAKVLLISDRYLPEVGGSIYWFDNLYRRYPKDSVWILTQAYPGSRAFDSASGTRIRFTRVKLRRHAFLRPESLLIYVKLLFHGNLDRPAQPACRSSTPAKCCPKASLRAASPASSACPTSCTLHGEEITIFSRNPDMLRHLRKVYDGAARVVANSSFTANCVRNLGCHGENVVRISPGVDPDAFRPGPRNGDLVREQRLEGKTVLLSVGRLQKRKGHDNVLRAMPEILAPAPTSSTS
jgi:phosphatidylinositol alpha-1,6-mannosyltransferase